MLEREIMQLLINPVAITKIATGKMYAYRLTLKWMFFLVI